MKPWLIAMLLMGAGPAWAQPSHCLVASLVARGTMLPEPSPKGILGLGSMDYDAAVLDMRGRWVVSSWPNVAWVVDNVSDSYAHCIARELLARRREIEPNTDPDSTCPPEPATGAKFTLSTGAAWQAMNRIMSHDPVLQACRQPVVCRPGDVCS